VSELTVSSGAPTKEEPNDGNKGNNASRNSASNRTNIAAASRTRWGIRHNDNRRLISDGSYVTIGLRGSERMLNDKDGSHEA
jgi:hypothetical protein